MTDFDNEKVCARDAVALLRLQKHDFLNYMQIVSGYLQLGKIEKAQFFIDKAIKDINRSGSIMRLADPGLGMNLLLRVHNAYQKWGVNIHLSASTDLALLSPGFEINKFLSQVFTAVEEVFSGQLQQPRVEIEFLEMDGSNFMTIALLPYEQTAFNSLSSKVKQAAEMFGCGFFQDSLEDDRRWRLNVALK